MKKHLKWLLLGLGTLVAYVALTGGIVVDWDGGFRWAGHTALRHRTEELQSSIGIVDEHRSTGIPFILWLHYSQGEPYPIELRIVDNTRAAKQITLHTITVSYGANVRESVLNPPWTGTFTEMELCFGSGDGTLVDVPVTHLREILPVTVDEDRSCEIRLAGTIQNVDGTSTPFDLTRQFDFQPQVRTYTVWSGLHD